MIETNKIRDVIDPHASYTLEYVGWWWLVVVGRPSGCPRSTTAAAEAGHRRGSPPLVPTTSRTTTFSVIIPATVVELAATHLPLPPPNPPIGTST